MVKPVAIKVSPAMISAALKVLYASGRLEFEALGADELVVQEMLEAALAQSMEPVDAKKEE